MLTLRQKIGQMMMVGFDGSIAPPHILQWLADGRIGGVYLFARNIESPAQVKRLVESCRQAAKHPILIGIDQEGGIVARLREGFSESPGAMALAASRDPSLAEDIAYMMGCELAALGINWNLAPVADLVYNKDNPSVSTRSCGADPHLVSKFVTAQIKGFQRAGLAATVKHFPGLGNTVIDTHDAIAKVEGSLDYLAEKDLIPFRKAIDDGVACVMLTHVMFEEFDDTYPATMSPRLVTGLLREELQYDGAVCTDCMEMKAITDAWSAGESAVLSVLAGVDLPLFSHTRERQTAAYEAVLQAAESGRISVERIDQSVERIQSLKQQYGLQLRPPLEIVDCAEHRALAKQAARAGTALLYDNDLLPVREQTARLACVEFASEFVSDAVEAGSLSGFSRHLQQCLPQIQCHIVDPYRENQEATQLVDKVANSNILILATRNALMSAKQAQFAQSLIDRHPRVILVCLRNPYDAALLDGATTAICTFGDSAPSLEAAVDAICGDYLPLGKLPVPLA